MQYLWKMAFRDLLRNRRRSFFSSLAVAMGLGLLMMMASFVAGEFGTAMDNTIKLQTGHIQVRATTYNQDKVSLKLADLIADPENLAAQISALPHVLAATPRLFASGIVVSQDESAGVQVIGIDPNSPANDPYREGKVAGEYLTADDREGIYIGQPLAENLKLQVGDTLQLMVNSSNGEVNQQNFTIRGIYSTKTRSYDLSTVFLPLAKAQAITSTEKHASTIFVMLSDRDQIDSVSANPVFSGYKIENWKTLNALLLETEDMANSYIYMLYIIVLGVTATVIINTLIMSVYERTREIGILSALGLKGWRILLMFFLESSFLAIGGIIMGVVIGLAASWYFVQNGLYIAKMGITGLLITDTIYAQFVPSQYVALSILAFIITLLAALYPASVASRMEPVKALHAQ